MTLPSGCICPEENIEQGLASPDENARLAVMLGAFCGLRRIEMTRINLKTDLEENAEGMVLHVHGKGNKERMLPVPAKLASALRKRTGVWLFPGDVQGHCGVDYVAKRIKTVTGYPSHSLRRRFATCVYYRNGCNIVLVSRMLGHANIATTMRYIGLVQDEMRNAVESTTRTDMRLTMSMNQVVGTQPLCDLMKCPLAEMGGIREHVDATGGTDQRLRRYQAGQGSVQFLPLLTQHDGQFVLAIHVARVLGIHLAQLINRLAPLHAYKCT